MNNAFNSLSSLACNAREYHYYDLNKFAQSAGKDLSSLPISIKILLESLLRNCGDHLISEKDVSTLADWRADTPSAQEIAFMPARVLLQDFTGVPAVVDLAALRSAMDRLGGDPEKINPLLPVDLVIDHSLQVDKFGTEDALDFNVKKEFQRNQERYAFLRWGEDAFENFRVIPPSRGIIHQVNLEYLARVVWEKETDGKTVIYPDSVVGTDSHTTMINGLGVLGWGVGGIEAEAVMLGQPVYMLAPQVVGMRLEGKLPEGVTATDLVLKVVQLLREHNVVRKFVEFYGPGYKELSLADRAVLANMGPEYGATMSFCPVDEVSLEFMTTTGRSEEQIALTEKYLKTQGLFLEGHSPVAQFSSSLTLDMSTVDAALSGPKRPQDRIPLRQIQTAFKRSLKAAVAERGFALSDEAVDTTAPVQGQQPIGHGAVVIAAITSCTNTSNPGLMIGAGLLAKKAVEKGLSPPSHVKTSLAPGSRVVTGYLENTNLLTYLEKIGFNVVGYGCTTCIGNSGPLPEPVVKAIDAEELIAAAVLSGNRNFEGRINPHVRANYLGSPMLVVAYALAGTVDIDLYNDPIGKDVEGNPVYLKDIWPSSSAIAEAMSGSVTAEIYRDKYADLFSGNEEWEAICPPKGILYNWNPNSTYVREPSFFQDMPVEAPELSSIEKARVLVKVGDSVTTDHISPAGAIAEGSPAADYLSSNGVAQADFNSLGSRRGNHEVMMRSIFANIHLKNQLAPGTEGGITIHLPTGTQTTVFDASMRYQEAGTSLVVLAGKDYGMGSSRDWAAKGLFLLGVKAVIAESYERIHRSNLIGMGILPLEYKAGETADSLGLSGEESFSIPVESALQPGEELTVTTEEGAGTTTTFTAKVRIDTPVELDYYKNGGILQTVLRRLMR